MTSSFWNVVYNHIGKEVDLTLNISGEGRFVRGVITNIDTDVVTLDSYRPSYIVIGKEKMKRTRYSQSYVRLEDIVQLSFHTHDDLEKVL